MMKNNKKLAIAGMSTLALAAVAFGAYAYFSDTDSETTQGTVGTVKVDVSDTVLDHSGNLDNINPGDNDPENPDGNRDGSDHELSFKLSNKGNKSIITRTVITITGVTNGDVAGFPAGSVISSDELLNILLSEKKDTTGTVGDTDADKHTAVKVLTPDTVDKTNNKVVYVIGGDRNEDVLSGVGTNNETETANGGLTEVKRIFDVGLSKNVTQESPLMGATITFEVKVEAMQYRNTGTADWETIFTDTVKTYTNN